MKRWLVVDDSRVVRLAARRILQELRFEIDEAANGREALAACERAMPDAILLDWNMPEMNGLDFLKVLRARPAEPRPLVVFCTSENEMSRIALALEAGADEYIMKPFDRDILESKLQQMGLL